MKASDLDRQARALAQDAAGVHWLAGDVLDWINAFQLDVLAHKPKAFSAQENLTLAANTTRQTLPAGRSALFDIVYNTGVDGATPGRGITLTTVERMNAAKPAWRADTDLEVRHWIADERDPFGYHVWPAPLRVTKVAALTAVNPTKITDLTTDMALDDSYMDAGVNFLLFKFYSQDAIDTLYENLASAHYLLYANTIGIQVQKQKKASAGANSAINPAFPAVDKTGAP